MYVVKQQKMNKMLNQHDTYQLRRARAEADGKSVSYARHTVHKCEKNNVVIANCWSRIVEVVEHREVNDRLDNGTEMINCVPGKKVCQRAHSRFSFPKVLHTFQCKRPQSCNLAQKSCMDVTCVSELFTKLVL